MVGGLLVLFPLFGCVYLIVRIARMLTGFIKPLLGFLPQSRVVGLASADVASIAILVLLCFLVGISIRTSMGKALERSLSRVLNRIPGYRMFRRVAQILFDHEDPSGSPVLVQRGQSKQIGFMVEENSAEEMTVFFPSAPSPFSGNIVIVKANAVEKLNVRAGDVARVIATFGAGTSALLADGETKKTAAKK